MLPLVTSEEVNGIDVGPLARGAFSLTPSACGALVKYRLCACLAATGVSATVTLVVSLYNLTNLEVVTDSALTCTNTATPTLYTSAWLIPEAAAGRIRLAATMYEARIALTVGSDLNDVGGVGSVWLERVYA